MNVYGAAILYRDTYPPTVEQIEWWWSPADRERGFQQLYKGSPLFNLLPVTVDVELRMWAVARFKDDYDALDTITSMVITAAWNAVNEEFNSAVQVPQFWRERI